MFQNIQRTISYKTYEAYNSGKLAIFENILIHFRASSPKSPNQNWDGSWGYQNEHQGYQSDSKSFIDSQASSPVSTEKICKKEKKSKDKEKKADNWDNKWGDDELWESLNN